MPANNHITPVQFREIKGYPEYHAGNDGSIGRGSKILKPWHNNNRQYLMVSLCNQGFVRKFLVHRLIAEAFHGPCPPGMQCRHLDGDRLNNRPENLAWGTSRQNQADSRVHGTRVLGERHPQARLTENKVRKIRRLKGTGMTIQAIADRFGVNRATIHDVLIRRTWNHV